MQDTQKQTGLNSEAGSVFVSEPAPGMYVKAKFDKLGRVEKAIIRDEPHEIEVRIKHEMGEVTIMLSWRGFEIKMKEGFGYVLPAIFYEDAFKKIYKLPIEYFKVLLLLIVNVAEEEYEVAQELLEKMQEELGE